MPAPGIRQIDVRVFLIRVYPCPFAVRSSGQSLSPPGDQILPAQPDAEWRGKLFQNPENSRGSENPGIAAASRTARNNYLLREKCTRLRLCFAGPDPDGPFLVVETAG